MRAQHDLIGWIEQRRQAGRITQHSGFLVVHQRFGAPDGRDVFQRASGTRPLAGIAIGQTGQIVVHRQLGLVPCAKQAIGIPSTDPFDRRFDHVDTAGFQRHFALGKHRVLIGLLVEIHGDAGGGSERREHSFGQGGIPGPAHEVQLSACRIGAGCEHRGGKRPHTDSRVRKERPAAYSFNIACHIVSPMGHFASVLVKVRH